MFIIFNSMYVLQSVIILMSISSQASDLCQIKEHAESSECNTYTPNFSHLLFILISECKCK